MNKQGRGGGAAQKERSIWEEARAQELIQRVLNKELSLTAAAVRLGVDTNTFFAHITDNGKNKVRVGLLLGTDGTTTTTTATTTTSDTTVAATASYVNANANHSEDSNPANPSSADPAGEDCSPPGNNVGGGQASDDSNAESLAENMKVEVNGEEGDNEEADVLNNTRQTRPTLELQESNAGDDVQASPRTMETFQSIVEDDGNSVYADAS